MKLMVRVRPGVELTCASFWPSRELIRLDLPTFERPRKANSGGPSGGKNFGSAAEVRNLAMKGFMSFILSLRSKPLEVAATVTLFRLLQQAVLTPANQNPACPGPPVRRAI